MGKVLHVARLTCTAGNVKRAVLEDLFKALLHKLMTGEVRVGVLRLTGTERARA